MNTISNSLLLLHIISGFIALALFWVPVFTRKGGVNHRKVGQWYVWAMCSVALTAFVLSVENLMQGNVEMALFLGFLSLLTARPLWLGIECLQSKHGITTRYRLLHVGSSVLVSLAGVGLILYGALVNGTSVLMYVFGVLGLSSSVDAVQLLRHDSVARYYAWLDDHIANMCITGIASHTAFLVFGASSVIEQSMNSTMSIVVWVAPTVVGTIGIRVAKRRFKGKSSSASKPNAKLNSATNIDAASM